MREPTASQLRWVAVGIAVLTVALVAVDRAALAIVTGAIMGDALLTAPDLAA